MEVPFLNLAKQNRELADEILPLWKSILESAQFIGGEHVVSFEKEFAAACEVSHCAAVASGTDALRLIFISLGLQPGDEVITVPNTFIATTEAITQAGGSVRFIDIDPDIYNLSPTKLSETLAALPAESRKKIKGIVPVHLYGQMADMDEILAIAQEYNLWVVEDASQAHLAEYKNRKAGSMGVAAAFSFYPGKNLGAGGEAGAVVTNDESLLRNIQILRDHGQEKKYYHQVEGYNSRCDALQTALLRVKLKRLTAWNEARKINADLYFENLKDIKDISLPTVKKDRNHVFHLFIIQLDCRDEILEKLKKRGIHCGLHYPIPLHLQDAYSHLNLGIKTFPVSEGASKRILSLPMYPELEKQQVQYICDTLRELVV
jgi:dTDP-4-amino-4,6-dideoxygalactose transaminase